MDDTRNLQSQLALCQSLAEKQAEYIEHLKRQKNIWKAIGIGGVAVGVLAIFIPMIPKGK